MNEQIGTFRSQRKSIELGMIDELEQDKEILEKLQKIPILKNQFTFKRPNLPNEGKKGSSGYGGGGSRQNSLPAKEMATTTQLGKVDWYRPKLSRKPFLKESLPSYKASEYGLFNTNSPKQKVQVSYQRKVGKGIDLSEVLNSTYTVEK